MAGKCWVENWLIFSSVNITLLSSFAEIYLSSNLHAQRRFNIILKVQLTERPIAIWSSCPEPGLTKWLLNAQEEREGEGGVGRTWMGAWAVLCERESLKSREQFVHWDHFLDDWVYLVTLSLHSALTGNTGPGRFDTDTNNKLGLAFLAAKDISTVNKENTNME